MTQLLLFDAPAGPSPAFTPGPVAAESIVVAPAPKLNKPEPGLNHMGDLARLVILRYELVAKRRAAKETVRKAK